MNKKTILVATTLFAGLVGYTSAAQAVLHGFCAGCSEQTIGGDDVTVLGQGGVTNFGFNSSPATSGNLQLKFLIPDSFTLAQVQAFAAGVSVTGTSSSGLSLFSTTPWTGGFLETDYLGNTLANGAPKNPLDAWLGATQTLQASADGYYVLTANMGSYNLVTPGQGPSGDLFSLSPAFFPAGGLIAGNLFTPDGVVSTAQSSALFFGGPNSGPFCTEPSGCTPQQVPGPIVGAGLPGLIAGCLTLLGLGRWRRKRQAAA